MDGLRPIPTSAFILLDIAWAKVRTLQDFDLFRYSLGSFAMQFHRRSASSPAARHDLRSRRDHGAGSRSLFPHGAVSGYLHLKARGGGQLDDLADRQPY